MYMCVCCDHVCVCMCVCARVWVCPPSPPLSPFQGGSGGFGPGGLVLGLLKKMIDVLESVVGLDLDGDGDRGDKTIPPIDPQNQVLLLCC